MAKTYESYKDSGIAWIGEIPSEWKVCRYKNLCIIQSGSPFDSSKFSNVEGFPLIRIRDITSGRIETYYEGEYSDEFIVHKGDLLVGMDGDFNVRIWQNNDALLNQRCCRIFANNDVDQTFIYFTLPYILERINKLAYSTTVKHLSTTDLYDSFIMLPSLKEQHSIASFLDTKCGEIDSLISLQEEMISELQAYKQSVITEAVTKGLDPNAKMNCCASREKNDACISSSETQPAIERKFKDSGVEWIGEIPEGWEVLALKRIFKIIAGATPKSENEAYWDGDIAWITPADYKTEQKYVSFGRRNLSEQGYHACSTVLLPKGSIVFSKRAPIGLVAITERELCTNQGCLGCVPIRDVSNVFMYYLLSVYTEQFELYGSGTTFKEISANNFANFKLMLPPLSEQQAIASYLDAKTSQIDSLISLKQQKIDELKDYKKSIIYEYVTGKKRV